MSVSPQQECRSSTAARSPRCCIRAMIPADVSNAAVQGDKDAVAAWLTRTRSPWNDVDAYGASLLQLCVKDEP